MANLKVGAVYDVSHRRKGDFRLRVKEDDGDWVTGVIVAGVAEHMAEEDAEEGDSIQVRKALATFTLVA